MKNNLLFCNTFRVGLPFLLAAGGLCGSSCTSDSTSESFVHNIEITELLDSVMWNDLVDSIEYIPLEYTPECSIEEVEQLLVGDGYLFVYSGRNLHVFNPQGKYLYSIEHGHAKNEVIELYSANLWQDQLCIYDVSQQKEVFFEAKTGRYLNSHSVNAPFGGGYQFGDLFLMEMSRIAGESSEQFRFWIWNNPQAEPAKYISLNTHNYGVRGDRSVLKDGLIYSDLAYNQAYKVSAEGMTPYIKLCAPEAIQMPKDVQEAILNSKYQWDNEGHYLHDMLNIQESESFITAEIGMGNHFNTLLYDKTTHRSLFFNRVCGEEPWQRNPSRFLTSEGDYLYCVFTPDLIHFIKILEHTIDPPSDSLLVPAYNTFMACQENDNPIIVRFKLKHIQ